MLHPPARIIHALVVGSLKRIGADVEELREAQRYEGLFPSWNALGAALVNGVERLTPNQLEQN
jgi:hypothetical protein